MMNSVAMQGIERRPDDDRLDYGFRPMRNVRWYKRAQEQGEQIPLPFTYPGVRQR